MVARILRTLVMSAYYSLSFLWLPIGGGWNKFGDHANARE